MKFHLRPKTKMDIHFRPKEWTRKSLDNISVSYLSDWLRKATSCIWKYDCSCFPFNPQMTTMWWKHNSAIHNSIFTSNATSTTSIQPFDNTVQQTSIPNHSMVQKSCLWLYPVDRGWCAWRFSQTMASEWQTALFVVSQNAMMCLAHCRQEL